MSRRQKQEDPFSDFPTPGWVTDRLIDRWMSTHSHGLPFAGKWLEPTAGAGGIIERFKRTGVFRGAVWDAWEIQQQYERPLLQLVDNPKIGDARAFAGAYARLSRPCVYDVAVTNPPYPQAMELLRVLRKISKVVVMLLRVNFLASEKRYSYWTSGGMPREIWQLPDRPKFKKGGSDSTEYGWFIWDDKPHLETRISMLALTLLAERKRWEGSKAR